MFRKVLWLIPGIDSFYLFNGLLSGLRSLLRMFCFLCFTSAVSNKFNLRSGKAKRKERPNYSDHVRKNV